VNIGLYVGFMSKTVQPTIQRVISLNLSKSRNARIKTCCVKSSCFEHQVNLLSAVRPNFLVTNDVGL